MAANIFNLVWSRFQVRPESCMFKEVRHAMPIGSRRWRPFGSGQRHRTAWPADGHSSFKTSLNCWHQAKHDWTATRGKKKKWKCLKNVNRHTGTFVWSLFLAFCRWSLVCRGVPSSSARRLSSCRESNMTSGHVVTVTLLSWHGYLKPKPASVSPSSCDSLSSFARTRSRAHAHRNSGSWSVGNVSDIFMDVKTAKAMSDSFFVLRAEGIGVVVGGIEGGSLWENYSGEINWDLRWVFFKSQVGTY